MKALFFLRHFNDIDHITPIIDQWINVEKLPAEIILRQDNPGQVLYNSYDLRNDFRLRHLARSPLLRIHYFHDFIPAGFNINQPEESWMEPGIKNLFYLLCPPNEKMVVVFDWTFEEFVKKVLNEAKSRGIKCISLPHGGGTFAAKYENRMIAVDDLGSPQTGSKENRADTQGMFDLIISPNYADRQVFRPEDQARIKVMGFARYCRQWLERSKNIVPRYSPEGSENKLKIAMFLRSWCYPIFWDEVARTVKLVTNFPGTFLTVQHHTRENDFLDNVSHDKTYQALYDMEKERPNSVKIVDFQVPSRSILMWADIVLDLGTSLAYEPISAGKPVLELEYLHALQSRISEFLPRTHVNCRPQLYDWIEKFVTDKQSPFYDRDELDKFIAEHIECTGYDVLGNYVQLLKELCRGL